MLTAKEANSLYSQFLKEGRLVQRAWHLVSEGRQLACALGVLGEDIDTPGKCPASVMPAWLASVVVFCFDGQEATKAFIWGARFYTALEKLDGEVPDAVRENWLNGHVVPFADLMASNAAKSAKHAKYAESAEYAAEYAAKFAAKSAKYAKYAESAEYAAEYAAKSAAESAIYAAEYAAKSAAEYAAKSAAESAKFAAKSAKYAVSTLADALVTLMEAAR